jgi:ADP-ribosylglycohydrolase
MTSPRKEQFSGCLIGQCLGDALGSPVEGKPPDVCAAYVEDVLRARRVAFSGRGRFPFGQYTDDSQLARELLQSYVACRGFDPADYACRIAAIFVEKRIVGPGPVAREAAMRLAQRVPWDEAGTPPPAALNGSAMRAGPVGLIFPDDTSQRIQAAHDQGRITHLDPRCSAGAVAVAGAVALALQGGVIEPEPFLSQLAGCYLRRLVEWGSLPPGKAATLIAEAGQDPGTAGGRSGISAFVTGSVLWSLYAFLQTPEDYWETICTAIEVGGDVDTTAAMAGAISGGYLGLEALPSDLAHHLTDQGSWGFTELVELAHDTFGLATLPESVD